MARNRKGKGQSGGNHGNGNSNSGSSNKAIQLRNLQNRVRRLEAENDRLCRSLAMARADCEILADEAEVMSGVIDTLVERNSELAESVAVERARQRYAK